jgi:Flp pilus assembly protein TadD
MADGPTDPLLPVAHLEQCVTVVPDDVELKADLGAAYERAGRPADAEQAYLKIIAIDPDYADVRMRLAKLMHARGAIAEARLQAQEALRVQPNRLSVRELLDAMARQ